MMKKILYTLVLITAFGCSNNDDETAQENTEFLNQVLGMYEIRAAYTDISVDLNNDGEANTNLFYEVTYCTSTKHLISYKCIFSQSNFAEIAIDIPYSAYHHPSEEYSTCLSGQLVFYKINIDGNNETVSLIPDDWHDDYIAQFNAEFIEMYWENEVAFITIKKQFFNSNEEWQEVTLFMEFEKLND